MNIECLVKAFFSPSFVVIWKESIMGRRDGKAVVGYCRDCGLLVIQAVEKEQLL